MKRRTKAQKFADFADAFKCLKQGEKMKRSRAKDGSIITHPTISISVGLSEKEVLTDCLVWLRAHRIFCNRHDCGTANITGAGYAQYGIRGAGDIIGLLPNGKHFEIECKAGKGGRLSKEQQKRWQNIEANNGIYRIVHGVEELEYYFKDLI